MIINILSQKLYLNSWLLIKFKLICYRLKISYSQSPWNTIEEMASEIHDETAGRRTMQNRGLIFSLSGPCELLFLLCFIGWVLVSVMLYPCMFGVALLMAPLFCVMRVGRCLWIVWWNNSQYVWVWLLFCCWMLWSCLLEVLRPCMVFQREFVCCACDPRGRLDSPSICLFVLL